MRPLFRYSEPYAPQGNIDAKASDRAIGRPQLDMWDVVLRETLQNSWDARLSDESQVAYSADAYWPTESQILALRRDVFAQVYPRSQLKEFLDANIEEQPLLVITDAGTKGLGGPTRADLVTDEDTDFVDMVRNVGRAADKRVGGGTYGFGKGVLWQASSCSTVIIYSKATFKGRPVSRFIAMGHTDSYAEGRKRYTGRHWWGRPDETTMVEPVEGQEADRLALALGMKRLEGHQTGTSLMILGPLASDNTETLSDIVQRMGSAALWWAWPHMVDETIDFSFTDEGSSVAVPRPYEDPVLQHFAAAYQRASANPGSGGEFPWRSDFLRMQRPKLDLGSLVWRYLPPEELLGETHVPITSHIALMRRPRLIVKYLPVRDAPKGQATVGVFVASDDADEFFASAEPVAHDDWAPTKMGLAKGARNPVKYALERIRDSFGRAALSVSPEEDAEERRQGLVHLSTALGDMVVNDGDAASVERGPSGGGGTPRKLRVRVVGTPSLELDGHEHIAVFQLEALIPASTRLPVGVTADPYVVSEAGRETDTDLEQPEVRDWRYEGQEAVRMRRGLRINKHGSVTMSVHVAIPADSAVGLGVRIFETGPAA
ncbi:hypothetical protein [Terrabacter sp. MAHUQ-38]|uniref:hypothetical protein n=1 Tax=unclassified Terrabacter TaxID=2630222 RepID=UPI00165DB216|nr:hypothetical protein [Terrabacter sp. MAHUQ-38]MBC9819734.1 hypothetical protein [Terrabacter sp. MAHUQ-38]